MIRKILVTCLGLALMSPLSVFAGPYLGASIGNSWYSQDFDAGEIADEAKEISENSTGWKFFGGFKGDSFLSVEGGYRELGKIETEQLGQTYDSNTKGWDVEAMGSLTIAVVDIFAKAGAFFWNTEGNVVDESGTAFLWGVGAGVHLGPVGVRLEWEALEVKNPDSLSMLSLGATLGF